MTRFLLIRHAMTEANGKRLAGRLAGLGLDGEGRRQAEALAERLADAAIAAIYSSPLQRAIETAAPIARLLGLEVATREEFDEIDFGEWTNGAIDELARLPQFRRFNTLRSCTPVPGGESMLAVQARMVLGLDRLRALHPQQTVAVVGHGDPIRSVLAYYAGVPLDLLQRLDVAPASVSVVEIGEESVRILSVNQRINGSSWPGDMR